MRVARRRDLTREQCEKIDEAIRRLVCDPAKAVRWHIVAHIDWLCETKPDLMWELAEHSVAEDTSPRVLSFMFHACRRLVHRAPPMVTRLACRALDRFPESGPEGGLNQQAYDVLAEAAIFHSEPAARARLDMLLEEPITDASPLSSIVHDFRDLLMYESDVEPDRAASIRMNAISFYERAGRRAAQQLADIMREYGLVGPMPNDAVERGRSAAQVLDALALSLYFALETDRQGRNGVPGPTEEQRRRLFVEARGIIQVLAEVRHPTVHHNFVKMLGCAVHLEPRAVVELVARSLRTEDAFDARHYEQLTLDELVKIGETLLADHRDLLEDVEISASFIAALDGFVRAGWPEAHRLVRLFEDAAR